MQRQMDMEEPEAEDMIFSFYPSQISELERLKQVHSYSSYSDAFVHWCVQQISPTLTDDEIISAVAIGGPGDKGIDAAWYDKDAIDPITHLTGIFYIAQGKCTNDFTKIKKFNEQVARELRSALTYLKTSSPKPKKTELEAIRQEFNNYTIGEARPTKLIALIGGLPQKGLIELIENTNRELCKDKSLRISFELFDINRIQGLYYNRLETIDLPIPKNVSFKIVSKRYIRDSEIAKALIAEVPLDQIYALVETNGLALFAKNLRVPIISSRYNEGIKDVLDNPDEMKKFWFYNNGITAICNNFNVYGGDDDPEYLETVDTEGLQVVNGCQTCYTIFEVGQEWRKKNKPLDLFSNSTVLIRLIQIGGEDRPKTKFAHQIARYTNSQTPITPRDLRATDPEQGRIKQIFAQDWKFFFEVKKNEWKRRYMQDRSFKSKFTYPYNFDNERTGQAYVSVWKNSPTLAKGGKRKIFENNTIYDEIFGFNTSAEALLLAAQFTYILDGWRRKRNFKLRNRGAKRRARISKQEVLKHGDMYLLSMIGVSIKKTWKIDKPTYSNQRVLEAGCENFKALIQVYGQPPKGKLNQLLHDCDKMLDNALTILYRYCREKCALDPEITVRNLLVRTTTWEDLLREEESRISKIGQDVAHHLEKNL